MIRVDLPVSRIRVLSGDAAFLAEVEALYAALDERTAARGPVCVNRGLCCQFEAYGHSLFVTPVELAYFLGTAGVGAFSAPTPGACPHQRAGMCTVRHARPMGCRVFYCDAGAQDWQAEETEHTLDELKQLHVRYEVPYAYCEWLDALGQLNGRPSGSCGGV